MIQSRTNVIRQEHVISWDDISDGLKEKLGFTHLRDRPVDGGPGFDFWLYFSGRVTEYVPDGITECAIDLLDHIQAIEEHDFTSPHEDDEKALPILKALAEIISDDALKEGFYVDFC